MNIVLLLSSQKWLKYFQQTSKLSDQQEKELDILINMIDEELVFAAKERD